MLFTRSYIISRILKPGKFFQLVCLAITCLSSVKIFSQTGQDSLIVTKQIAQGDSLLRAGAYIQSLDKGLAALGMAVTSHCRRCEADALHSVGNAYYYLAKYELAIRYFHEGIDLSQKINYKKGLVLGYTDLGLVYFDLGDYATALDNIMVGDRIAAGLMDNTLRAMTLNSIGITYEYQGNLDLAMDYYRKSLQLREKTGDKQGLGYCYNNIGSIEFKKGNYQKSLEYHLTALSIRSEINDKYVITTSLNNIAQVYYKLGKWKDAESYYKSSLEISQKSGDKYIESETERMLSALYQKQGNIPEAQQWAYKSLNSAIAIGAIDLQKEAHKILSEIAEKKGDFLLAFTHLKSYSSLKDSIFNARKFDRMQRLESQVKAESSRDSIRMKKMQSDIAFTLKTKQSRRIQFFSLLAIFILVVSVIVVLRMNRRILSQKKLTETVVSSLMPLKADNQLPEAVSHFFMYSGISVSALNAKDPMRDEAFVNLFTNAFDTTADEFGLVKIYTLSDEFVFYTRENQQPEKAAKEIIHAALKIKKLFTANQEWEQYHNAFPRIGIHYGVIFGNVVGTRYAETERWCRPVEEAAAISLHIKPGQIAVSESVLAHLKWDVSDLLKGNYPVSNEEYGTYYCIPRNKIEEL